MKCLNEDVKRFVLRKIGNSLTILKSNYGIDDCDCCDCCAVICSFAHLLMSSRGQFGRVADYGEYYNVSL